MLVIQRLKRQVSCSQGAYVCIEVTWEPNTIKPERCAQYWRIVSVGCMATTALIIVLVIVILCESPEITVGSDTGLSRSVPEKVHHFSKPQFPYP